MDKKLYIQTMAASFGAVVSDSECEALLDKTTGEINRRLLELIPKKDEQHELLRQYTYNPAKQRILSNISAAESDLKYYTNEINKKRTSLVQYFAELNNIDGLKSKAHESLCKIVDDGWFTLDSVDSSKVTFITGPVHLFNSDINKSIYLGRFFVSIKGGEVKVLTYENNKSLPSEYYHPHISRYGDPCWGSAAAILDRLPKEECYYELMMALKAILQQYNGHSPYRAFHEWLVGPAVNYVYITGDDIDHYGLSDSDAISEEIEDCPHDSDECAGDCDREVTYKFGVYEYEGKKVFCNLEEVPSELL